MSLIEKRGRQTAGKNLRVNREKRGIGEDVLNIVRAIRHHDCDKMKPAEADKSCARADGSNHCLIRRCPRGIDDGNARAGITGPQAHAQNDGKTHNGKNRDQP